MPPLAAIGPIIGAASSAIGGIAGAAGSASQAANAKALGDYEQAQYEQEAETSIARSQRKMEQQQRSGKLVQSELTARAAGAGITPSVGSTNILSQQIAGRNTYSALSDLSAGEDLAAGYRNQGAAAEYQGQLAMAVAPQQQIGAYAGAASSAFGTLGKGLKNFVGGSGSTGNSADGIAGLSFG